MSIGDKFNKNRGITASVCVLVLAGVGYFVFVPPPKHVAHFNYYDLTTGQLVSAEVVLDLQAKHLVDAVVVSCGDCADAKSRVVAYISKANPDAHPTTGGKSIIKGTGGRVYSLGRGLVTPGVPTNLVAKPDTNPTWVGEGTDDGNNLVSQAMKCSSGSDAKRCAAD